MKAQALISRYSHLLQSDNQSVFDPAHLVNATKNPSVMQYQITHFGEIQVYFSAQRCWSHPKEVSDLITEGKKNYLKQCFF